jgi:hypothetical protein
MAQPFVSAAEMLAQRINYVCLSFGDIDPSNPSEPFVFPGGGCEGDGDACLTFMRTRGVAWLQTLHDAGVTISISLGGAGAHLPSPDVDAQAVIESFERVLGEWGVDDLIDGIDFDWEDSNLHVAHAVNKLAPAFKARGYVVTGAPMASQLHAGCGYGWNAGHWNEWALVDHTHVDGILVQWYQPR